MLIYAVVLICRASRVLSVPTVYAAKPVQGVLAFVFQHGHVSPDDPTTHVLSVSTMAASDSGRTKSLTLGNNSHRPFSLTKGWLRPRVVQSLL